MLNRRLLLQAFAATLTGCLAGGPPLNRGDRTYINISADNLYPLLEEILLGRSHRIDSRIWERGYIRTNWREYEGDAHGLFIWREQRRYIAWFDINHYNNLHHILVLQLDVQERAPSPLSIWHNKRVDTGKDSEYQEILFALDSQVTLHGGKSA
jgi:hypothetical protein